MALLIQPKAAKTAKDMPRQDWDRLKERLERIAQNPRGNHPNVGPVVGTHYCKVRHGDWRAIYEITDRGDVDVVKIGHRREVYRL